jgi:hypothetical protein
MKRLFLTGVAALLLATGTTARAFDADESAKILAERCKNGATFWCEVLDERRKNERYETRSTTDALPQPRPRGVDIPSQYRGVWCATRWTTIYRRCPEPDEEGTPIIDKRSFSWGETGECIPLAITARNGELRVRATCNDIEQGNKAYQTTQFRWRLGTRNQRLQILDYIIPPSEGR